MKAAARARVVAAWMLLFASITRAEDRAAAPADPSQAPPRASSAAAPRTRAAGTRNGQGRSRRPPSVVLVLPLLGLVLLPLTLPMMEPRNRHAATPAGAAGPRPPPGKATASRSATPDATTPPATAPTAATAAGPALPAEPAPPPSSTGTTSTAPAPASAPPSFPTAPK